MSDLDTRLKLEKGKILFYPMRGWGKGEGGGWNHF